MIGKVRSMPLSSAPVFDRKPRHAAELVHIVRDHRQIVGECDRGDHEVIAADQFAPQFEMMADSGVDWRGGVIKRKRAVNSDRSRDFLTSRIRISIFAGAMQKFRSNNRANNDLRRESTSKMILDLCIPILEIHNPHVRIDEKAHHHSVGGAGGGSSGASSRSPSKLPAVSSKYPSGHPRASVAGFLRSARESSIKSLTTRSSLLAESSSSSRSLFSNSAATALMRYRISPQRRISRRRSHSAPIPVRQRHRLSPS